MNADLKTRLKAYVRMRQALGFSMDVQERLLLDFVCFVQQRIHQDSITAQVVFDWIWSTASELSSSARATRLSAVRGFLSYLQAFVPSTQVPTSGLIPKQPRPQPYLFSQAQIGALLEAARSLGPRDSLRPHTYFTLIGLLASCGLRGGEVIRLNRVDVQLDQDPPRLHVQLTKFRKSRLVPVHLTTAQVLRTYSQQRNRRVFDQDSDAFFVSDKGTRLNYHVVARTVVRMARRLGIRGPVGERGPSLHGLRHTFAVQRLRTWYQQGVDPQANLPDLSVYLGHARIEGTYWYLTATPELLGAAATRFESYCPEGGDL